MARKAAHYLRGATVAQKLEHYSIPEPNSGCFIWLGYIHPQRGYAQLTMKKKNRLAHILAYELANGPVPPGLELDHKCRVRCCVNPAHLEAVTHTENVIRGLGPAKFGARVKARWASRTHCKNGHELTADNLYRHPGDGRSRCRACKIARARAS